MKKSIIVISFVSLVLSGCQANLSFGNNVNKESRGAVSSSSQEAGVASNPIPESQSIETVQGEKASFLDRLLGRGDRDSGTNGEASSTVSLSGINKNMRVPVISRELPDSIKADVGAELFICRLGSSCSGDMGSVNWGKESGLSMVDKKRALKWSVKSDKVDAGLLQVFRSTQGGVWPGEPIYTRKVAKGEFVFDFSVVFASVPKKPATTLATVTPSTSVLKAPLAKISPLKTTVSKPVTTLKPAVKFNTKALASLQPSYYVRIVPLAKDLPAGKATNEIKAQVVPPQNQTEIKLYSPAKIYDIKIKDFQPLKNPDKGVCSHAMIVDVGGKALMGKEYKVGERICPAPYRGVGEEAWYESFWNALSSGVDWVSEAYNDLKGALVSVVGAVACGGNDTCEAALATGLDIALVAMGVPPTIPNFDQLMDEGFDYVVSQVAAAAGCVDPICQEAIRMGVKTAVSQQKNPNPACMDATVAHDMGIEPLCLPPGIKAHWDESAMHRPAKATLVITRNQTKVDNEKSLIESGAYRILVSSYAKNTSIVGAKITNIEPYGKTLTIDKPLEGEIFKYTVMRAPYLEMGKSMEIPIVFAATDYWVPGHKELMEGWSTVVYKDGWPQYQYNDWWKFYYDADLNLVAQVDGCGFAGLNDCSVSIDSKKIKLPMTLNP